MNLVTVPQLENILQLTLFMFLFLIRPIPLPLDPYVIAVLISLYCDYSLYSLLEHDSIEEKPMLQCSCTFSTSKNLRSRRNSNHMFTQLNSSVQLYPSFSQLFTLMRSITKAQGQPAETFFYSAKKQQNSHSS